PPAAAFDQVSGFDLFRERHRPLAVRTAHPIREGGNPLPFLLRDSKGVARTVRAVREISGPRPSGQLDRLTAVRAADLHGAQTPRSRFSRPRSNPTITSSSTAKTGRPSGPSS